MLHVQAIIIVEQREGGGIQARQRFLPPTSAFPARADGRRDKSLLVRIDLSELLSQLLRYHLLISALLPQAPSFKDTRPHSKIGIVRNAQRASRRQ